MQLAKKFVVLICSIILALASYANTLSSWTEMIQMRNIWVELPIVAATIIAWLGQSPIKPKQIN